MKVAAVYEPLTSSVRGNNASTDNDSIGRPAAAQLQSSHGPIAYELMLRRLFLYTLPDNVGDGVPAVERLDGRHVTHQVVGE